MYSFLQYKVLLYLYSCTNKVRQRVDDKLLQVSNNQLNVLLQILISCKFYTQNCRIALVQFVQTFLSGQFIPWIIFIHFLPQYKYKEEEIIHVISLVEPGFLGENLKKYFKPKIALFWRKKPKVAFPQKVT